MLRVGCSGFPVARERYWRELSFVEADLGGRMPRPETLAAWRADMPQGAEAAALAYRLVTHGPSDAGFPEAGRRLPKARQQHCGAFRETLEVYEAWVATRAAALALGARVVLFQTPPSFQPGPDRLRDLYRFFRKAAAARGGLQLVWQPLGGAWGPLADRVCAELGLVRAFDPLREKAPARGPFRYLRPRLAPGASLSVDNVATIKAASAGTSGYLALSHRAAFDDARRLRGRP